MTEWKDRKKAMIETSQEILVIDDERQIRRLLRIVLTSAGYRVRECDHGQLALSETALKRPDAIILDLGLPDMSGLEVLKRLREWTQVPILILTAWDREDEMIQALDAGADDYLTKPFSGRELLARLRVIFRRSKLDEEDSVHRIGSIVVDLSSKHIQGPSGEIHLTAKEYALLRILLLHRGRVLTHRQLLREVWGPQHESDTHYLRVHMTHLRQKLGDTNPERRMIRAESGLGYKIDMDYQA